MATTRDIASIPSHPNSDDCVAAQTGKLYTWLAFLLQIGQIDGVKFPKLSDFSAHKEVERNALERLKKKFDDTPSYVYDIIDQRFDKLWNVQNVQSIAHQADCVMFEPFGLARELYMRLNSNSHADRLPDPLNPQRTSEHTQRQPGDVTWDVVVSDDPDSPSPELTVFHLFAQREVGGPTTSENAEKRFMWFRDCLDTLALLCEQQMIFSVAFPRRIGCSSYTGGDWVRYEQLIRQWALENQHKLMVIITGPE